MIMIPPKKTARRVVKFRPELRDLRYAMLGVLTLAPQLGQNVDSSSISLPHFSQ
jgi:hypothetical protein